MTHRRKIIGGRETEKKDEEEDKKHPVEKKMGHVSLRLLSHPE